MSYRYHITYKDKDLDCQIIECLRLDHHVVKNHFAFLGEDKGFGIVILSVHADDVHKIERLEDPPEREPKTAFEKYQAGPTSKEIDQQFEAKKEVEERR